MVLTERKNAAPPDPELSATLSDEAVPLQRVAAPPSASGSAAARAAGGGDFWSRLAAADNDLPELSQLQQFQALGIGAVLAVAVLLLLYWAGLI